jgi:hypothetical protein
VVVSVGKTPYARFDLNDYSVPHEHVRKSLTVAASPAVVRILDGPVLVASHRRSFDRGAQVEDPAHVQALVEVKAAARAHRGVDRLNFATPSSKLFLKLVGERRQNLGAAVSGLLSLLDRHGATELEAALAEAAGAGVGHLGAVKHVLDRRREERGLPPPTPVPLPDDPKVRDIVVTPHPLSRYDAIGASSTEANGEVEA